MQKEGCAHLSGWGCGHNSIGHSQTLAFGAPHPTLAAAHLLIPWGAASSPEARSCLLAALLPPPYPLPAFFTHRGWVHSALPWLLHAYRWFLESWLFGCPGIVTFVDVRTRWFDQQVQAAIDTAGQPGGFEQASVTEQQSRCQCRLATHTASSLICPLLAAHCLHLEYLAASPAAAC